MAAGRSRVQASDKGDMTIAAWGKTAQEQTPDA